MYCIHCGVKMDDGEKSCPLCHTEVCHPDYMAREGTPQYPRQQYPAAHRRPKTAAVVLTIGVVLIGFVLLLCNLQVTGGITWSGFAVGALLVGYVAAVLPLWFTSPNPVIFTPCAFVMTALYLLYIDMATGPDWFAGFSMPLVGGIGVIVTAVVTLLRYVRGGRLYISGGACIALGLFMLPIELLMAKVFSLRFTGWSLYPLVSLVLLGGTLLFFAIYRPAREMMERKFFI